MAPADPTGDAALARILHVAKFYPPVFGGMERVVQMYSEGLAQRGHQVTVLSFQQAGFPQTIERPSANVTIHRLRARIRRGTHAVSLGYIRAVRAMAPQFDIVHVHEPFPAATLAAQRWTAATPLIVSWHADITRMGPFRHLYFAAQDRVCAQACAILCAADGIQRSSLVLPRHGDRVKIVPLGLDLTSFMPDAVDGGAVDAIRARIGRPFVLSVGRLVSYKGFDTLIAAAAATEATIAIVGTGPLDGALRARAQQLGIADRVIFAGAVSDRDLPAWYAAADVYVLASITGAEAFGLVQIEAMASGKPVINTALDTGVPEVSLHEKTGLTVPPGDVTALAAAIGRLMSDDELRTRLGAAARLRALEVFDAPRILDRLEAVYAGAIAGRAALPVNAPVARGMWSNPHNR